MNHGTEALLKFISANKIPIALVTSNLKHITFSRIRYLEIIKYFNIVITYEDTARAKPFPDPFLLASKKLSIPPKQCVVFEDSMSGLQSAYAAGMCPIWIPDIENITIEELIACKAVACPNFAVFLKKIYPIMQIK